MSAFGRECPLGDPAEGTEYEEEEAPYYDDWELDLEPHPGHLFPSVPDDTEAALRAADEIVESLANEDGFEPPDYTPSPPTLAELWPPAERAELARRLATHGVSITELSDVREACGLPRLSESSSEARRYAHHLLAGRKGKEALAAVRRERAELAAELARPGLAQTVREARRRVGVRGADPSRWRLGELREVAELVRDVHDEPATPLRLVRGVGRAA